MRACKILLIFSLLCFAAALPSEAGVYGAFRLRGYRAGPRYAYRGGYYWRYGRPYRRVWAPYYPYWGYQPVVIASPGAIVVPQTYPVETPVPSPAPVDRTRRDLSAINSQLYGQRTLLKQKLDQGLITQSQYEMESAYLDSIYTRAHSESYDNGGYLTGSQERELLDKLHQSDELITHNLTSY